MKFYGVLVGLSAIGLMNKVHVVYSLTIRKVRFLLKKPIVVLQPESAKAKVCCTLLLHLSRDVIPKNVAF